MKGLNLQLKHYWPLFRHPSYWWSQKNLFHRVRITINNSLYLLILIMHYLSYRKVAIWEKFWYGHSRRISLLPGRGGSTIWYLERFKIIIITNYFERLHDHLSDQLIAPCAATLTPSHIFSGFSDILLQPNKTPKWTEALWKLSVFLKNTTPWPLLGLNQDSCLQSIDTK